MTEILALDFYKATYSTQLTTANLLERTITMMQWVENHQNTKTGAQKESVVHHVMETIVGDSNLSEDILTKTLLSALMPSMIHYMIKIDKNHLKINPKATLTIGAALKCVSCLFPTMSNVKM